MCYHAGFCFIGIFVVVLIAYFLTWSRLVHSLRSWGWPWTPNSSAFTSCVLRIQACLHVQAWAIVALRLSVFLSYTHKHTCKSLCVTWQHHWTICTIYLLISTQMYLLFWVVQQLQQGILVSVVNFTESRLAWETVSGNAGWGITMLLFTELGIPLHQVLALLPAWDAGLHTWRKAAELQDAFISLRP